MSCGAEAVERGACGFHEATLGVELTEAGPGRAGPGRSDLVATRSAPADDQPPCLGAAPKSPHQHSHGHLRGSPHRGSSELCAIKGDEDRARVLL